MNDKNSNTEYTFYAIASIVVIWFAILVAPHISGGIPELIKNFGEIMNNPFNILGVRIALELFLFFYLFME